MKHILAIVMITGVICVGLLGCNGDSKTETNPSAAEENISKEGSYVMGMTIGTNLINDELIPNMDEFFQGIKDVLSGAETRYAPENASQILQQTFMEHAEQRNQKNMQGESEFLAENSMKPGVIATESGLQYEVITAGTGPRPNADSTVLVHYEGSLTNGSVFDSSHFQGQPAEINLTMVIPGFAEGLQLMNVGSKYRFTIPSDLGYGPRGAGQQQEIPPYSTLIFDVDLLEIIQ